MSGKVRMKNDGPRDGPKMQALPNERWRLFVRHWLALADEPRGQGGGWGYTEAARRSGFTGTSETLRATAYKLAHDQRIQEAIQEEARKALVCMVPDAMRAVKEITNDKLNPMRLAAAKTALDRAGLHEVMEQRHTHEFIGNDPAMLERVRQLALRLNMNFESLVGHEAAKLLLPKPKTVDAEYEEVEASEEPDSEISSPAAPQGAA